MKIGMTEAIRKPCLSGIRIASLQTLALPSVVYLRQWGRSPAKRHSRDSQRHSGHIISFIRLSLLLRDPQFPEFSLPGNSILVPAAHLVVLVEQGIKLEHLPR